jgi:hypothetical protein
MVWDGVVRDMPKLKSPFIRKEIDGKYVVTPEIEPGYEWVFEDPTVLATEKLNGTDVSLIIENGQITQIYNRTARIPFFNKGKRFIIDGMLESFERGYCNFGDGQYFGELIGEKLAKNPYLVEGHVWIPFLSYCREKLSYNSYHKYPKTFENLSKWFKDKPEDGGIFSLFMRRRQIVMKPEGVVFHNVKTGEMAKLRCDMFDWWDGDVHKQRME